MDNSRFIADGDTCTILDVDGKILNFNPYHDPSTGRFTTGAGGSIGSLSGAEVESMALDYYTKKFTRYPINGGNGVLAEIYKRQGFNEAPKVVDKEEFNAQILKEGRGAKSNYERVLYRGVREDASNPNDHKNQFRYGAEHYPGQGHWGNGTYTSNRPLEAINYSSDGSILRLMLDKKAKGIGFPEAYQKSSKASSEMKAKAQKYLTEAAKTKDLRTREKGDALYHFASEISDPGAYAAIQGYDYVGIDTEKTAFGNQPNYIILNRGAVIVDAENYKEGVDF